MITPDHLDEQETALYVATRSIQNLARLVSENIQDQNTQGETAKWCETELDKTILAYQKLRAELKEG